MSSSSYNLNEDMPLLRNSNADDSSTSNIVKDFVSVLGESIGVISKSYATLGPAFMAFSEDGGNLVGMTTALAATVTLNLALKVGKDKLGSPSDQEQVKQIIAKSIEFIDKNGIDFLSDYGFTWSTLQTIDSIIRQENLAYDTKANLVLCTLAAPIALLIRAVKYREENNIQDPLFIKTVGKFFQGATSPSGLTGLLALQNYISSSTSLYINLAGGILGIVTALTQSSYEKVSFALNIMMQTLLENPSLAAMVYSLPLNIQASLNDDEVSDWLYYGAYGPAFIYLMIKSVADIQKMFAIRANIKSGQVQPDEERGLDELEEHVPPVTEFSAPESFSIEDKEEEELNIDGLPVHLSSSNFFQPAISRRKSTGQLPTGGQDNKEEQIINSGYHSA